MIWWLIISTGLLWFGLGAWMGPPKTLGIVIWVMGLASFALGIAYIAGRMAT